jgi:two-component system response regulator FixJ
MSRNPKLSVCLVDDDAGVREAFAALMKSAGLKLVTFTNATEFLGEFKPRQTGCLILDVRLPGTSGLELLEILGKQKVAVPILMLTGHADVPLAVQATKNGAFDVIEKPINGKQVLDRINKALAIGKEWKKIEADREVVRERLARLTRRELQVLDLMVGGRTNKAIAEHLKISRKTLDIHRGKVIEKMEARTVADLVRFRLIEKYPPSAGAPIKEFDLL